ncbi:CubicO group peptidase, beta-lactamase class C family [Krasilnikoviella flava]|uniref:CubicO group peptidase, beta-lactamase class C family n=2 Tax=Krasilnikoviella flava TaxID=526729 RepID=A0A1T5IHT1_9MICO|nr:CubicO group peptidase, beta-lactamase class C family [Krasilnikoviella flava]
MTGAAITARPAHPVLADGLATVVARAHELDVAVHTVDVRAGGERLLAAGATTRGHDVPQRMYSVSKTITGLAVGLLAAEGALSLDDPVVRHFPDLVADVPAHPWLEATTLHHMLAMVGPHRSTTYKVREGGWLESYFRVPPTHPPGTLFTYDTSASYTLAALVERTTGGALADYLRPRVLDPIGVSPGLRFLPGPDGFSHGGSGLICTPDDLARLARLLNDGGVHDGARLLPADYLGAATSPQSDPATQTWGGPFRSAYGYQLWLPPAGGWLMFGLGGQIVYGDPELQVTVVVTADSQAAASGDQKLLDLVLDHLVEPARALARDARANAAPTVTDLAWPAPRHDAAHARPLTGTWATRTPDSGPDRLTLDVDAAGGTIASSDGWSIALATAGARATSVHGEPAIVTAGWSGPGTLDVRVGAHGDELATIRLRLALADDGTLAVQSQGFGETLEPRWTFHAAFAPAAG